MWMAQIETGNNVYMGMAGIAASINLPVRPVQRAGKSLQSAGILQRGKRGLYVLNVKIKTTSASLETTPASLKEPESETTPASPDTTSASFLTRAADNNNNNYAGGQASLLTDPEWVTVIHGPDWVNKRLTPPQIATIDRTYGRLNLMIEATKWADHWTESRPSRRPKAVARSFINWCINEVKRNGTGSTTGISQSSSALRSGRPLSGPDRPRGKDIYIPGQTQV